MSDKTKDIPQLTDIKCSEKVATIHTFRVTVRNGRSFPSSVHLRLTKLAVVLKICPKNRQLDRISSNIMLHSGNIM